MLKFVVIYIKNYTLHTLTIMYFNYHNKVKELLRTDTVTKIEIVDNHNGIKPAMLLHFKNHKPMPIREHKWDDYIKLIIGDKFE